MMDSVNGDYVDESESMSTHIHLLNEQHTYSVYNKCILLFIVILASVFGVCIIYANIQKQ